MLHEFRDHLGVSGLRHINLVWGATRSVAGLLLPASRNLPARVCLGEGHHSLRVTRGIRLRLNEAAGTFDLSLSGL